MTSDSLAVGEVEYRRADAADLLAGREVVRVSMGWRDDEPNAELFAWKHEQSPFGTSPAWVALIDGRVVGFRTFMRWQFLDDQGERVSAVRAVDKLTADGVGLVFNTPNDQSRPGYLTMGWAVVGQLPLTVRPRSLARIPALRRARVPAERWSQPTTVGLDAAHALADEGTAAALLAHAPQRGWRTDRSPGYLAWRFGLAPLRYRVLFATADPADGGVVFRLRRRGPVVEAAIAEQLVPDVHIARTLVRKVLRETGADYAAGLRSPGPDGLRRVPRQGPTLAARQLAIQPTALAGWALTLGDIELF